MENFKVKLHASYEKARLRKSLWPILPALIFAGLGAGICHAGSLAAVLSLLIAILAILCLWRGQEYGKAVIPALFLALIGLLLPALSHFFGVCCRYDIEIYICIGTGVLLGFLHGYAPARNPNLGYRYLFAGAMIIGLAGTIGCSHLGASGFIGMVGGLLASSITSYLILKRV